MPCLHSAGHPHDMPHAMLLCMPLWHMRSALFAGSTMSNYFFFLLGPYHPPPRAPRSRQVRPSSAAGRPLQEISLLPSDWRHQDQKEFVILRTAGLVDQYDEHIANLTVHETLDFATACQVGKKKSDNENIIKVRPHCSSPSA